MDLAAFIEALARARFPGDETVERVVQTHASVVYLTPSRVYKVKKPVDLGFLDYSTLERRRGFCHREVELNRAFSRGIYEGVIPIFQGPEGKLLVGAGADPTGEPMEYAVQMKRLPDAATLESRLARGELRRDDLVRIGRFIAGLHDAAARVSLDEAWMYAGPEAVRRNCEDNFETLRPYVERLGVALVFERLVRQTKVRLEHACEALTTRAELGFVRATHGDLRLDHVYTWPERPPPDDLAILDCIEFNDGFRISDVVADLAFLTMDLRHSGAYALADALVEGYFSATDDPTGRDLLPLYTAYRAAVRAKVEALRSSETEVAASEREASLIRARGLVLLAAGELLSPRERPILVLVAGLPGTGKSTLSRALAERAGLSWVRADVVRKGLAQVKGEPPVVTAAALYCAEWTERTYDACLAEAKARLLEGERVVLDATFRDPRHRLAARALAVELGVPVVCFVCVASGAIVRSRLESRVDDPSDADVAVYEAMAATWKPVSEFERTHEVDTGSGAEDALAGAVAALVCWRMID